MKRHLQCERSADQHHSRLTGKEQCVQVISTFLLFPLRPPRSYQALQEASGPRDDDENLPHQLDDKGNLLTFRALVGLHTFEITSVTVEKPQRDIKCKKERNKIIQQQTTHIIFKPTVHFNNY